MSDYLEAVTVLRDEIIGLDARSKRVIRALCQGFLDEPEMIVESSFRMIVDAIDTDDDGF